MEQPNLVIFAGGTTAIALDAPGDTTPSDDRFNPMRVGLDHLALACTDVRELRRVAAALSSAGIDNTGVKTDPTLNKEYVAFKDPDGIAWELYMA
jgi:catechol 2,3-dioxygenase-like lactoylglutathione lyase family enzyme